MFREIYDLKKNPPSPIWSRQIVHTHCQSQLSPYAACSNEGPVTHIAHFLYSASNQEVPVPPSDALTARKSARKLRYFRHDTHLSSRLGNIKRIDFVNNFL